MFGLNLDSYVPAYVAIMNMDMGILRPNLPLCICFKLMPTAQLCAEKKRYYVLCYKTRNLEPLYQEG